MSYVLMQLIYTFWHKPICHGFIAHWTNQHLHLDLIAFLSNSSCDCETLETISIWATPEVGQSLSVLEGILDSLLPCALILPISLQSLSLFGKALLTPCWVALWAASSDWFRFENPWELSMTLSHNPIIILEQIQITLKASSWLQTSSHRWEVWYTESQGWHH